MVQIQSDRESHIWIYTDRKHRAKIEAFMEENYGKIILHDYRIVSAPLDNVEFCLPYHMVGLDILIRFIADLEFDEVDTT